MIEIEDIKRGDIFTATLLPPMGQHVKPGVAGMMGRHLRWRAGHIREEEPFKGEWHCVLDQSIPGGKMTWAPISALRNIERS
jgi:hypothetical protein